MALDFSPLFPLSSLLSAPSPVSMIFCMSPYCSPLPPSPENLAVFLSFLVRVRFIKEKNNTYWLL
jgi:hypothetical protein